MPVRRNSRNCGGAFVLDSDVEFYGLAGIVFVFGRCDIVRGVVFGGGCFRLLSRLEGGAARSNRSVAL